MLSILYFPIPYCLLQEELVSVAGRVVVVSFGHQEGATRWLEDTGCPFPMLLDGDRQVL